MLPCLEHDHENVLLKVLPSIVIGIMIFPPSAARAVFVDTAKLTLEDVLLTVIPLALLIVKLLTKHSHGHAINKGILVQQGLGVLVLVKLPSIMQ